MVKRKSKSVSSERKPDDVSHIKNKQKRSAVLARVRDAKARAKKEAKALEIEKARAEGKPIEKQVPPTVESQRCGGCSCRGFETDFLEVIKCPRHTPTPHPPLPLFAPAGKLMKRTWMRGTAR